MKKSNKTIALSLAVVFSCVFSLLLTHPSFADIDGPYSFLRDYEYGNSSGIVTIRVTNPEGADLFRLGYDDQDYSRRYEFEKHVPYGTILNIASYSRQDYASIREENTWLEVKLEDIEPTEPFDFSKAKESDKITRYVSNEKGCLYKGPDYLYGKVDDKFCLPKGIAISSTHYDQVFMFVEYEGHSGWVAYNDAIPTSHDLVSYASKENHTVYSIEKNYLYHNLEDEEPFYSFEVPELTEIQFKYWEYSSPFDKSFYVEYDGREGWIKNDIGSEDVYYDYMYTTSDVVLYTSINNPTEIVTIPAFTEVENKFQTTKGKFKRGYYLTVGEKSGWFLNCTTSPYSDGPCDELASEGDFAYARDKMVLELKNKKIIYTNINGEETGEYFDIGKYKMKYQVQNVGDWYWYYIEDDNHSGWIRVGRTDDSVVLSSAAEPKKETEELLIPESFMNENTNERDNNRDEDKENIEQSRGDEGNLLIFLIIGFGILSTSIIIALILAKKHKKNKENASDDGDDNSEKSEEKAEENKPNSNEDDVENESKIEGTSDENESNSEENSGKNEQNSDEDNVENEPESEKKAEENNPDSERDESETDQDFDDIPGEITENREENGNENSEEEEKSSEENESYFEKELKKIEEESEKKSDEIDQNFAKMEDEIEPNTTKIEDEIESGIAKMEEEIEPNPEKEQKKSSKKSTKKQMKEGGEDE